MTTQEALFEYCLRIGDNALIAGQRMSEWCGHGPVLEEDIAMGNISLDLIGQARGFLTYAGQVEGSNRNEDHLAYHRDVREFRNRMLVEQPNGDFACTMLKSFFFSSYAYLFFRNLINSNDETLSGLAAKSLKEVTYHVRHTSNWVIRLGDGTEESHRRLVNALDALWSFTAELFEEDEADDILIKEGIAFSNASLKSEWDKMIAEVFSKAGLTIPENGYQSKGGIKGNHTEHLGFLLAEMQFLPRAYPDATW